MVTGWIDTVCANVQPRRTEDAKAFRTGKTGSLGFNKLSQSYGDIMRTEKASTGSKIHDFCTYFN